jgi:hypothetical protein
MADNTCKAIAIDIFSPQTSWPVADTEVAARPRFQGPGDDRQDYATAAYAMDYCWDEASLGDIQGVVGDWLQRHPDRLGDDALTAFSTFTDIQ